MNGHTEERTIPVRSAQFPTVERTDGSAEFFDATSRGVLLLRKCSSCGRSRIARRPICRVCGESSAGWVEAQGDGHLVSWGRHPSPQGSARGEGLSFGLVELAEGPWLEALLVGVPPERLREGLPLRLRMVAGESGEAYPAFECANADEREHDE